MRHHPEVTLAEQTSIKSQQPKTNEHKKIIQHTGTPDRKEPVYKQSQSDFDWLQSLTEVL